MSCVSVASNGKSDCESYLQKTIAAVIIEQGGHTFTAEELDNISTWVSYLSEDTNGVLIEFNGTEPTDAEVQQETTGFGTNIMTYETAPSLLGYAKSNACDFIDMLNTFDGQGSYEVFLYNQGGKLVGTRVANDAKGFKTQVLAKAKGAIGSDNQTQQYAVMLNFIDEKEWRKPIVIDVNYDLFELFELMPDGLKAPYQVEATTGGLVSFAISERCKKNSELSEVLTGNVIDSNIYGSIPTATPTYNATTEKYDWVITTDGSTAPSYGDVFEIRAEKVSGATKEKVSNIIKVTIAKA